jgi:type I restriction enzyme R subunit
VLLGRGAIDKLPAGIKKDPEAVAETITNNVRKVIIDERAMNPKYYDKMSELLDALIDQRRQGSIDYKQYLEQLIAQAQQIGKRESDTVYPAWADNGAKRALIDFEFPDVNLALTVDQAVMTSKPDRWIGNVMKEKKVKRALRKVLPDGYDRLDELFDLVKARDEYR